MPAQPKETLQHILETLGFPATIEERREAAEIDHVQPDAPPATLELLHRELVEDLEPRHFIYEH